jgi:hypothetical protein
MTIDAPRERLLAPGLGDYYLLLLSGVLMGYALIGRGFAYLGVPPLFVGDFALLIGAAALLRARCFVAALATLSGLVLAATMIWVLIRTLPFVSVHGVDALRDSVIVMYGGFAFILTGLLLEDSRRLKTILGYYGSFLAVFVPAIPFVFAFNRYFTEYIPNLPGYGVPVLQVRPGEVAVHLAGAAVFALGGFRKFTLLWTVLWLAALVMVAATNRGAMLAATLPVGLAALVLGRARQLVTAMMAAAAILGVAYAIEGSLSKHREAADSEQRLPGPHQIVENITSIFEQSGYQTEGTKQWRLEWWHVIVDDTVFGPRFWAGRGFGLNLAEADGFAGNDDSSRPPLRSPHNAHLNILARAGVTGLALWALLIVSWLWLLTKSMLAAQLQRQYRWANLFLLIICYVIAILINSSFDVALEGPMQGIWFWCLIGFGTGAAMIYRARAVASPQG